MSAHPGQPTSLSGAPPADSRAPRAHRPALLMCEPTLYSVNYVINPWMAGNVGASSQPRALRQWTQLHARLCEIADVSLIDPAPGWPDMVFTANAGLVRDGIAVVSRFLCPERQGEEAHFRRWFAAHGYTVVEMRRETPFEGEGDALFSAAGDILWVGHGPRTAASSHQALRFLWPADVIGLELVDPRFYHLDTCFAPLADGSLLFYPGAFSPASLRCIEAVYPAADRIAVGEADATCFACNAVNLGTDLVLNHISRELAQRIAARGFHLSQLPLDEFLKAGGAAKCLVMHLPPERQSRLADTSASLPRETGWHNATQKGIGDDGNGSNRA